MAQERRGGARRLARRYGLTGRAPVAIACVVVLVALVGIALARGMVGHGSLIERAPAGEAAASEGRVTSEGATEEVEGAETGRGGEADESAPVVIVVHVDGAVVSPGVYELPVGARVNDATLAAGGLAEGADTSGLNLAATLFDGDKVHVPVEGEGAANAASALPEPSEPELVNINTADVAELDELPGVGESTAEAIIEDRERNGPFTTIEDIMRVSGIGEKKFEKLVGRICV